jgi:hypothetical protein
MMPRSLIVFIAALGAISAWALPAAHADQTLPVVFSTVDGYRTDGNHLHITGVIADTNTTKTTDLFFNLHGESPPSVSYSSCERAALMMLNRPGRFILKINFSDGGGRYDCELTRHQP